MKNIFIFILSSVNDHQLEFENKTNIEDIKYILDKERAVCEKMFAISNFNSMKFNSIHVTKISEISEIDEQIRKYTSQINDDIIEKYENEFENFIINNDEYTRLNKINFYEKDSRSYRFCSFCLHKKVVFII